MDYILINYCFIYIKQSMEVYLDILMQKNYGASA